MDTMIPKNLRNEQKSGLKLANKAWTDCVVNKFLDEWLSGKDLNVLEVCKDEYSTMSELDKEIYGDPFSYLNRPAPQ